MPASSFSAVTHRERSDSSILIGESRAEGRATLLGRIAAARSEPTRTVAVPAAPFQVPYWYESESIRAAG